MSQRASLWGPLTDGLAGLPRGHLINKPCSDPFEAGMDRYCAVGAWVSQTYSPPPQGTLGSLVRLVLGVKVSGV